MLRGLWVTRSVRWARLVLLVLAKRLPVPGTNILPWHDFEVQRQPALALPRFVFLSLLWDFLSHPPAPGCALVLCISHVPVLGIS